jgi:hypothetical protein
MNTSRQNLIPGALPLIQTATAAQPSQSTDDISPPLVSEHQLARLQESIRASLNHRY